MKEPDKDTACTDVMVLVIAIKEIMKAVDAEDTKATQQAIDRAILKAGLMAMIYRPIVERLAAPSPEDEKDELAILAEFIADQTK